MAKVSFQLNTLGWKSFQSLCLSVLSEIFGQTVQGFFDSNDGGRDGAFYGEWKQNKGATLIGSFTIQCKFTSKPDRQLHAADISDELAKAERLAQKGMCRNYVLLTNFHLTGKNDEKVVSLFESLDGVEKCLIFGQERLNDFILESPRLRMLVPRVYGLGDLSLILDERAQTQASEILSSLGGDLDKFVTTRAHERSARALVDHGFVLLLGEPACGKSTIAASLSMAALDEWQCSTIKARGPDDFVKHWNPNDPRQFFWIDDAFGATQLDNSCLASWNKSLPHVHAAIKKGRESF